MGTTAAPSRSRNRVRPVTLVWIDGRQARIYRWRAGTVTADTILSDTPSKHRSTGHVRHDPGIRHGGSGTGEDEMEHHRLEHQRRYVAQVAARLDAGDRIVVLGPGVIADHLVDRLALRHDIDRSEVALHAAPRLSDRQLIARLREEAGAAPARGARRAGTAPSLVRNPEQRPASLAPRPTIEEWDELVEEGPAALTAGSAAGV